MHLLRPDWPAPRWVQAAATTRVGGVSTGPYAGLNLAAHVGDDPQHLAENRARLQEALALPTEPLWLNQVHGCAVVSADAASPGCEADAALTGTPGVVCAVLTADCLPLLLCDHRGLGVAAVHAGWRGLAAGVIERTVHALRITVRDAPREAPGDVPGGPPADLLAWLGPAIGPAAFEVGPEVRAAFLDADPGAAAAFRPAAGDRWWADLYALARARLARAGVSRVYGGGACTWSDPGRYYSYRRDGVTGRMASLIWLAPPAAPAVRPELVPPLQSAPSGGERSS